MTSRERQARRAFSTLGEQRVLAFLRAVRTDGSCKAVGFVNEQLDNGEPLEDIFFDGNEFGYRMSVKTRGPHLFEVEFGCLVAPLAGDGGMWEVEFDEVGAVAHVTATGFWIS